MAVTWVLATDDEHCPQDGAGPEREDVALGGSYIDDVTGLRLAPQMVAEGRGEELRGFRAKGVYSYMRRSEAQARGIKILGSRWVDRLKNGSVRSRLCAQYFNFGRGGQDVDLFAPTPPLTAARFVASRTASCGKGSRTDRRLLSLDFKKAFLNSHVTREVCIELPPEDDWAASGEYVGLLHRAMYGLREAPAIRAAVVEEMMASLGFVKLVTVPCVYVHAVTGAIAVAHVDDF